MYIKKVDCSLWDLSKRNWAYFYECFWYIENNKTVDKKTIYKQYYVFDVVIKQTVLPVALENQLIKWNGSVSVYTK